MKLSEGFVLRHVAGRHVVVPSDPSTTIFAGAIMLNESAVFLWEMLQKDISRAELETALATRYTLTSECAGNDLDELVHQFRALGILKEESGESGDRQMLSMPVPGPVVRSGNALAGHITAKETVSVAQWLEIAAKFQLDAISVPLWVSVTGESMYPFIRCKRDQVRLIPASAVALREGDMVLFRRMEAGSEYCLHRLYRIHGDRVQTFGDGNLRPDPWMSRDCILGKAVEIRRGGWAINCSAMPVRLLFRLWVVLAPIRSLLLWPRRIANKIGRIYGRFRESRP